MNYLFILLLASFSGLSFGNECMDRDSSELSSQVDYITNKVLKTDSMPSSGAMQCDIYEGTDFRDEEKPYDSCRFNFKTDIQGVSTLIRSCTLVEKESGIFYEIEARKNIKGNDLLYVERGNSAGYLPGIRIIYFEDSENQKTKRESAYYKGTTRIECRIL
jgi:hypothetical protein